MTLEDDLSPQSRSKPFDPAGPDLLDGRWRLLRVSTRHQVDHAPAAVWDVISDHATWTEWHEDYEEHEAVGEQITGIGARFNTKEWLLRSELEIVRWEPGAVIGMTILRSNRLRWLLRSYYSEVAIEPVDGDPSSSSVRYSVGFTGTWAFWLLSAYTIGYSLSSIYYDARSSLRKLDRYLESVDR